jgi:hypothetical protein
MIEGNLPKKMSEKDIFETEAFSGKSYFSLFSISKLKFERKYV